jgi:hypothetical protein
MRQKSPQTKPCSAAFIKDYHAAFLAPDEASEKHGDYYAGNTGSAGFLRTDNCRSNQ